MPDLIIRLRKKRDGNAALSCERADGSITWQRQEGTRAGFFPLHDLTHYAVETVLGHRRGFYGLVAEGWNLTDFGAPWPRGPIPADADPSEFVVGFLDAERAGGVLWSAADLNESIERAHPGRRGDVSEAQLARIRSLCAGLFHRWAELPADATLELRFEPGTQPG